MRVPREMGSKSETRLLRVSRRFFHRFAPDILASSRRADNDAAEGRKFIVPPGGRGHAFRMCERHVLRCRCTRTPIAESGEHRRLR